jgi:type II secretory pathway pseudopilin PulG
MGTGKADARCRGFFRTTKVSGFAYVLLLIIVATIGLLSASSLSIGSQVTRRDAEHELLAIGNEFEQALNSYARVSGTTGNLARGVGPRSLQDLLKDPRFPGLKRHLRQIYADPLTGRAQWGLVIEPGGSIVGIYSSAAGIPIQRTGFEPDRVSFENAESYANWIFGLSSASLVGARRASSNAESVSNINEFRQL